jgi:hypothetical protein
MRYLLAILRTVILDFVAPRDRPQARKRSRPIWRALALTAQRDECIADRKDAGF